MICFNTVHEVFLKYKTDILYIGSTRIGCLNMEMKRSPQLPKKFELLSEDFFSLATDDEFYLKLSKCFGGIYRVNILEALRDISYNLELFEIVKDLSVTQISLLRNKSETLVRERYHQLSLGNSDLSDYTLKFYTQSKNELIFNVQHNQLPPSNIHAIIGRNGVGKSYLLKQMAYSYMNESSSDFGFTNQYQISNLIYVNLSSFETSHLEIMKKNFEAKNKISYICPESKVEDFDTNNFLMKHNQELRCDDLTNIFIDSMLTCARYNKQRWLECMEILSSDPILRSKNLEDLVIKFDRNNLSYGYIKSVIDLFTKLSSGHKIVLLTITKLVSCATDKTLILMDEPELHLHPPLLGSFIRSISKLLINVNGIAIMATHSPVILQETNRECIYKVERSGECVRYERPESETFAENIGLLTSDVFGLEVIQSGFYQILEEVALNSESYQQALKKFNNRVGKEGRSILLSKTHQFANEE